jgi:hypothetical protein
MGTAFYRKVRQLIFRVYGSHFLASRAGIMRHFDSHRANPLILLELAPCDRCERILTQICLAVGAGSGIIGGWIIAL